MQLATVDRLAIAINWPGRAPTNLSYELAAFALQLMIK
jgi:hypothetical protein